MLDIYYIISMFISENYRDVHYTTWQSKLIRSSKLSKGTVNMILQISIIRYTRFEPITINESRLLITKPITR